MSWNASYRFVAALNSALSKKIHFSSFGVKLPQAAAAAVTATAINLSKSQVAFATSLNYMIVEMLTARVYNKNNNLKTKFIGRTWNYFLLTEFHILIHQSLSLFLDNPNYFDIDTIPSSPAESRSNSGIFTFRKRTSSSNKSPQTSTVGIYNNIDGLNKRRSGFKNFLRSRSNSASIHYSKVQ